MNTVAHGNVWAYMASMQSDNLITIQKIFQKLDLSKSIGLFETSDGRFLPRFEHYISDVVEYKSKNSAIFTRDLNYRKRKILFRLRRIQEHIDFLKENFVIPERPLRILEVGAGSATDTILWSSLLKSPIVAIDSEPWFQLDFKNRLEHELFVRAYVDILRDDFGLNIPQLGEDVLKSYASWNITYEQANACQLKFESDSFNIIVSYNVLMEIGSINTAVDEIYRVLKPGGVFIATWDYFPYFLGLHRDGLIDIPWGHSLLSANDFERYLHNETSPKKTEKVGGYFKRVNRLLGKEWWNLFEERFRIRRWQPCCDRELEENIPKWVYSALPSGCTVDDLVTERIEGVFEKRLPI